MYYVEKIINGILHCKHTPNGKWVELSKEKLTDKIVRMEARLIMERPNQKDYDFNDVTDGALFALKMNKYADYLEQQFEK
jgi:hypothetical protein